MEGTADIISGPGVEMVTDGPCLLGTLSQFEAGVAAKPMSPVALVKVRDDALALTAKVLRAYSSEVAPGEVGKGGSCRATETAPTKGANPTGLLYGRIQSGKTVAMISFCAAAIDNGFRVVVVLTSDFVKLVEQTAERFAALDGPLVRNSQQSELWQQDKEHISSHISKNGVVFICAKNQQRLTALVQFLNDIGAANYPALVLDDEADQATLDTSAAARAAGKVGATPSAIHRKTVQDDEGLSVRQTLRHHIFVQVTATPYALLLQNVDNPLRPSFTHLLEPGVGYTGGEAFFDAQIVEEGLPPIVFVDEDESRQIDEATANTPPVGLQKAIALFLVSAGAQNVLEPNTRFSGQNFLCHTSQKTADHAQLATLIRGYLGHVSNDLESARVDGEVMMRLHWGYEELAKTLDGIPAFDAIIDCVKRRLPRRDVPVVNSTSGAAEFSRQLNFIVGGNILGRGLTIDNLLVTYYLRRAKVSQMDTVLQHARMFGYRRSLMPYTRVFLPESLAARFHFIHVAERNLRQQLAANGGEGKVAVETMSSLRATRLNVLDTRNLAAYEAGEQIYPGAASFKTKDIANFESIERALKDLSGGSLQDRKFIPAPIDRIIATLQQLPYDEELANMWDPEMLAQLLRRLAEKFGGTGYFFYRTMQRSKGTLPTGALSGDELAEARGMKGPVLCAFRDDGKKLKSAHADKPYWYPTLVLPLDMATQLFNTTS